MAAEIVILTIFLDIDGVLNTPSEYGKRINKSNVGIFNRLLNILEEDHDIQIVVSSSWRLSRGVNKTIRDAGITVRLKGVTENLGDRSKEINSYISKNSLEPKNCLVLDDEKDIVKNVICKYYITNYKTGVVEDDIKKILKLIN